MVFAICENLKNYGSSKPPMVIFVINLGAFAVVLMTLAYIIKVKEQLTNPDLTKDWNNFFENFADVEFCVLGNTTGNAPSPSHPPVKLSKAISDIQDNLQKQHTTPTHDDIVYTSIPMLLEITPTDQEEFYNIPQNVTTFMTALNGSDLGLTGKASSMSVNVSMTLPLDWNNVRCSEGKCDKVQILTCINFQAPIQFFPSARQVGSCYSTVSRNETGSEFNSRMIGYPKSDLPGNLCEKMPKITMQYKLDPTMNMLLTLEDRSLINLHLMHTSYFLFVMIITVICYALIKGHPSSHKPKSSSYSEVSSQV